MLLPKENRKNLNTKEAVVAGNSKKKKLTKKVKERKRLRRKIKISDPLKANFNGR